MVAVSILADVEVSTQPPVRLRFPHSKRSLHSLLHTLFLIALIDLTISLLQVAYAALVFLVVWSLPPWILVTLGCLVFMADADITILVIRLSGVVVFLSFCLEVDAFVIFAVGQ